MTEQVNTNNRPVVSVYGFNPADCTDPKLKVGSAVAATAQSTIAAAPQNNTVQNPPKHSFSVISTIKALFAKIIEGLWTAFNKLRDLFWEVKIDMHMAGVEATQLNANIVTGLDEPVAAVGNAPVEAELPNVPYTTERFDIIAQHLIEARKAGTGHPAHTKLMALRGAFYNTLYPPTQQKLVRLVQEQLKDPSLHTLKDCLLNEQFWTLFSNSVERMYLQRSLQLLGDLQRIVQAKAVPFKARDLTAERLKLTKIDREYLDSQVPGGSTEAGRKFLGRFDVTQDRKVKILEGLTAHIKAQQAKLAQIAHFVEIGA